MTLLIPNTHGVEEDPLSLSEAKLCAPQIVTHHGAPSIPHQGLRSHPRGEHLGGQGPPEGLARIFPPTELRQALAQEGPGHGVLLVGGCFSHGPLEEVQRVGIILEGHGAQPGVVPGVSAGLRVLCVLSHQAIELPRVGELTPPEPFLRLGEGLVRIHIREANPIPGLQIGDVDGIYLDEELGLGTGATQAHQGED